MIFKPFPGSIWHFENALYREYTRDKNVIFEIVRNDFYHHNFGPKMEDNLKKNIMNTLKNYISYKNEFKIMFLFSFRFKDIQDFRKTKQNDDLIYLFKIENKIHLIFQDKCFEIDANQNLVECQIPKVDYFNLYADIKYHKEEFKFSSIEDITKNCIAYLFKVYFLGKGLLKK